MYSSILGAGCLAIGAAAQAAKGFNYGSTFTTGANKAQADFEAEFNQAKGLTGAPGFTSARLYTMIQGGTTNTPISAIPAAIATQTRLLLGLWASAGEGGIQNEIAALSAAISQYGSAFTNLIDGISVGSEDLYRISPTGIENMSGVGAGPADVANYITQVRNAIANTAASGSPIGHVDTWTAWVNSSNDAVINACDFIGMDAYPYFQNTIPNGIDIGQQVFNDALSATRNAVDGKPVWITETGWPVSGPQENQAVANVDNARTYWDQVGCEYFGNTNIWWYTLQDALPGTPSPSFGIIGAAGGETPLFDLSCSNAARSSSSLGPSASAQASSVSSAVSAAATGGGAAPTEGSGSPGPSALQGSSAVSGSSSVATSAHQASAGSSAPSAGPSAPPTSAGSGGASAPSAGAGAPTVMTTYQTTSLCPVTTTGAGGAVSTGLQTSTFTVTSASAPAGSQAPGPAPSPTSTSTSAGACPASLSGNYEFPHLIVPVDKNQPNTALGTSYNGTFSSTVSSLFNFDVPPADADKTCTLVFLMPDQEDLQTSSYELSGSGGIDVQGLVSPATQGTTYANAPAVSGDVGSVPSLAPGNSYTISSSPCASGQTIGWRGGGTSTSIDAEEPRAPPPPPTLVYFPQNDIHIHQSDDWKEKPGDLFKRYARMTKPSEVRPGDIEALNVSVTGDVDLEDLIPDESQSTAHLPPLSWTKGLDPLARRASLPVVHKNPHEHPLILCNGAKAPNQEDFARFARELSCSTEDGLRLIGRRKPRKGRTAPHINHYRDFWTKLEQVSQYWDTSLDDYYESDRSAPPSPTSPRSTLRRMSLFMTDKHAHQEPPPPPSSQPAKMYKGLRKSSGAKMPDSYRSELVRAFVKNVVYIFHCQMNNPRKTPQLEVGKLLLPVTQTAVVWANPEDKNLVKRGVLDGPVLAVQARHETQFVKDQNTAALDLARECACLLLLAEERAREGKPRRVPGAGEWYATKPRWGGGPGGEFGEAEGNTDEHPAVKRLTTRPGELPRRMTEEEIWKELKPNQGLWEPRMNYLAIGKDRSRREDSVFMISALFHHMAIVRLDVDPLYLDWLISGRKPSASNPYKEWYKPKLYRSQWFDLLTPEGRLEAFRGVWGMMSWLMRFDAPGRPASQRQHSEAHHVAAMRTLNRPPPAALTPQRSHSVAF
ncbi:MAG: hypothetical protein Q9162_006819 [Coniocarpon cinnabarinum]